MRQTWPGDKTEEKVKKMNNTESLEELMMPQTKKSAIPISEMCDCMEDIEWLWPEWIPMGMVTVLAGRAKAGKSFLALRIAQSVTDGIVWPDGAAAPTVGNVLWIDTEGSQRL